MPSIVVWTFMSAGCARNLAASRATTISFVPSAALDTFSPPELRKRVAHEPAAFLEDFSALLGRAGAAAGRALHASAPPPTRRKPVVGATRKAAGAHPGRDGR